VAGRPAELAALAPALRRSLLPALTVALTALAAGCAGAAAELAGPPPHVPFPAVARAATIVPPWVTASRGRFVDRHDRTVVLRGVDVGVTAPAVYERAVSLHANFVRIAAPWSLFEPRRPTGGVHHWDQAELAALDREVSFFEHADINVLIDFHQYRWSPYFAGHYCPHDCVALGIPAWFYANGRFPDTASGQNAAEAAFWTTESRESQAAYAAFAAMMATRYARYPNVVGYEIVNEPHAGSLASSANATQTMLRWQVRIRDVLRTVDPTRTVFVMCNGGGNGLGTADLSVFGSLDHLAIDWHDYYNGRSGGGLDASGDAWIPSWAATHNQDTASYDGTRANQQRVLLVPVRAAARWHVPLLIGEWGIHTMSPGAAAYQSQMLSLFARYGLSYARWQLTDGGGFGLLSPAGRMNPLGSQLARAQRVARAG
jgi:endoglycosylceramidase